MRTENFAQSYIHRAALAAFMAMLFVLLHAAAAHGALGGVITSFASPGTDPHGLAWDGTNIWSADGSGAMIYKLNPTTGAVITSFAAGDSLPYDMTFVGGNLWNIANYTAYSVDPSVGPPWTAEFALGDDYGIAYDGTNLWTSNATTDLIYKRDLGGNVLSSFGTPAGNATGLAWDGAYLWSADTVTDLTYKIDPATGNVLATFSSPSGSITGLDFDGTYLWQTDNVSNQLYQVDAGYAPVGPTPAPSGIVSLLTMLTTLGGWAGVERLRARMKKAKNPV